MAAQVDPEKMSRLNWRERWQRWRRCPQQTGSEYPRTGLYAKPVLKLLRNKPVLAENQSELSRLRLWLQAAHAQSPRSMPAGMAPGQRPRRSIQSVSEHP